MEKNGGLEGKNAGRCEEAALQPASGRGRVAAFRSHAKQQAACGKQREVRREREREAIDTGEARSTTPD